MVDNMDEKIEIMLDKKFDEIIAKHFSPLKESLETVKSSLNFLCSQYDELVKTVNTLQLDNKQLRTENSGLKAELLAVKNDLKIQKETLNEHEQNEARSQLPSKTTKDIGYRANKIYISESLTQQNNDLFKKCLEIKKTQKYKFIWTKYVRIFMRKNECPNSPVIHITSIRDLQKLKGN